MVLTAMAGLCYKLYYPLYIPSASLDCDFLYTKLSRPQACPFPRMVSGILKKLAAVSVEYQKSGLHVRKVYLEISLL